MGKLTARFKSRTAKIVLMALLGAALLFAAWKVFGSSGSAGFEPTKQEARLAGLLEQLEGVTSARAMIAEEGGRAVSAIVLFEGENSLLTRSRILDIASAALGLPKAKVQVFAGNGACAEEIPKL